MESFFVVSLNKARVPHFHKNTSSWVENKRYCVQLIFQMLTWLQAYDIKEHFFVVSLNNLLNKQSTGLIKSNTPRRSCVVLVIFLFVDISDLISILTSGFIYNQNYNTELYTYYKRGWATVTK